VVRKLAEERDYLTQYGFDESTEGLVTVPVMAEPDVPEETTESEGEDNGQQPPNDVS
jgi:hypothetical protein